MYRARAGLDTHPIHMRQFFQAEYTFGMLKGGDMYHTHVIRSRLTPNIAAIFDQLRDEAVEACAELIPVAGDGM
jgi:hypothetical protein